MSEREAARIGTLVQFKLGKGITREAKGDWTKEYIEVEMRLPENATDQDLVANFTATEYMIDQLLQAPATEGAYREKAPRQQPKITMTPQEIDAMSWIASNWIRKDDKDRNAKPLEDAWMKLENCDPRLVRMLEEGHGKLELLPYTFEVKEFADSGARLIVRRGSKGKKPRSP